MKKLSFVLAALLLAACEPAATTRHDPRPMNFAARPASRFNVRDFGATGDGTTLDTRAINAAIDAAVAAGGGIVVLPAGTYASFSIHLQSNITLQIDKGATLVAAGPPTEGPGSRGGFGGGGGGGGGGAGRGGGQGAGGAGRGGDASGAPGEGFNGGGAIYQGDTFGATDPTTLPSASQPARGGNGGGGGRGNGAGGPGGGRNGGAGGGRSNASQPTSQPAASQPAAAYDPPEPNPFDQYQDYGHSHWHNSLLWGEDLHNVAITGEGTIDGRGLFRSASARTPVGNKILGLKNCTGVTLRDITLFRGGHFCALLTGVDNLTLDHVTVDTNRDGFDIDACQHVSVIHCSINSPNDDGLVLKSSYALGKNRPADDVTITDCHLSAFDVGSLIDGTRKTTQRAAPDRGGVTGRIKLGTESNGGFTHITVANCTFEHCRGVALEAVDGGNITDVNVHDVTMKDVTSAPLFVRLGSRQRGPAGIPIAAVSRVSFSNITATLAEPRYASLFSGIPGHPIEDLTLSHLHLSYLGGGGKADAAITPPEQERGYPDPNMFGVVPAYGLYFRHVTGLKASDITLTFDKPDARPAIVLDDVQNATLQNIHAQHGADVPTIKYQAVKNLSVTRIEGIPDQKPTDGAGQW